MANRRGSAEDYRARSAHEAARISRRLTDSGYPVPLGDLSSGVVLVAESPAGPRLLDALERSLHHIGLPDAYVTYTSTGLLAEELQAADPSALVAVGPRAAQEIDSLARPLTRNRFSESTEGAWFAWSPGASGLLLPALAPALDDESAKRRFWRAFLSLRQAAG